MKTEGLTTEQLQAAFREEIRHHYDAAYTYRIRNLVSAAMKPMIKHVMLRGLENFRTIPRDVPLIISATHKSHLDYLLLDCLLLKQLDYVPCTIAGKNLFHGYFKTLLPKVKGICLDRQRIKEENLRHRENIIYLRTFYDYLTEEVFKKFEAVVIFPEAGRSYTGEVGKLAHGIFGMAKRAINEDGRMAILPLGITYERVTEDEVFSKLTELKTQYGLGKKYRKADLRAFWKHALFQARGKVLYSFGKPIYITPEDLRHLDELGEEIRVAMERETVLTPVGVVCNAFRDCDKLPLQEFYERIDKGMQDAFSNGYKIMPGVNPCASAGYIWKLAKPHLAMPWRGRKILKRQGGEIQVVNRAVVDYYINSVRHVYETKY